MNVPASETLCPEMKSRKFLERSDGHASVTDCAGLDGTPA
jgi:hypothetical protein